MTAQPDETEASEDVDEELPPIQPKTKAFWQLCALMVLVFFNSILCLLLFDPQPGETNLGGLLFLLVVFGLASCWLFVRIVLNLANAIQIQLQEIKQADAQAHDSLHTKEPRGE